jgi:hypothetical protein
MSKLFFLFYRFRNTYEHIEGHSLENCYAKILVLESESEKGKQISGSESEPEKNEFGSITLLRGTGNESLAIKDKKPYVLSI